MSYNFGRQQTLQQLGATVAAADRAPQQEASELEKGEGEGESV
jgi:hypothetical protein